jgi:excisionase family DNA binding protein
MEQIAVGLKEAAASVGLSTWTLRAWVRQGKVAVIRLGRRVLIEPAELRNLVAQARIGGDRNDYDVQNLGA